MSKLFKDDLINKFYRNPQNDLQAMARAHRIGQTKSVSVYRLLTSKTYEMHMFHSASMKLGLDRAVLAHQRQSDGSETKSSKSEKEVHAKEIDQLLKKGAYDVFRDANDEEAKKFMETDIDDLLKTSSTVVTYNQDNTRVSNGLGNFSKASFIVTGDAEEVDLDDPDFWSKAVGLEAPPETALDDETSLLIAGLESKRSRKQVQVYDPYAAFADREHKKQEKIASKLLIEKEEKERKKVEEKKKREEEIAHRQKEKDTTTTAKEKRIVNAPITIKPIQIQHNYEKPKSLEKDKQTKSSKSKKRRMLRAAEEKLYSMTRQVWSYIERDMILAQVLRFGFNRFTKIRQLSSLMRLPIQDIEVFLRGCTY